MKFPPILLIIAIAFVILPTSVTKTAEPAKPILVDVQRIWDKAPHNAFTDLIRHKDLWYCVFREGSGHVSPDGSLRVITSVDGKQDRKSVV